MTNPPRPLRAAAAAAVAAIAISLAPMTARADQQTPTITQDQANRLSIFHDYNLNAVGRADTDHTAEDIPGVAGGGAFTQLLGSWASADPDAASRSFAVSLAPLAGYDSNPEARRIGRGSAFAGGDFTAAYHLNLGEDDPIVGHKTEVAAWYNATGAVYEGQVQNADVLQQSLAGAVRHEMFEDTLWLSMTVDDQFTMEHSAAFLNTSDVAPAVEAFLIPNASIELGFDYTHLQYFFYAGTRESKPTADRNTLNLKGHLFPLPQVRDAVVPDAPDQLTEILRESLRRFTVGYGHVWNLPTPRGRDYEYEANRVYVAFEGVRVPKLNDFSLDLSYAHEFQNYFNPNSAGIPTIAGKVRHRRRHDGDDVLTVRANARLFDLPHHRGTVATFLQWDVIHDGSNLVPRRFNEFVVAGGLTYRY